VQDGIHYFVTGGGGKVRDRRPDGWREAGTSRGRRRCTSCWCASTARGRRHADREDGLRSRSTGRTALRPRIDRDRARLESPMLMELTMAAPWRRVRAPTWSGASRSGSPSFQGAMGVAAVHLDNGETIAVAADTRFPTASGIKTAVMVEVFQRVALGTLALDRPVPLPEDAKVGGSGVLKELHAGSALTVADLLFLMIAISTTPRRTCWSASWHAGRERADGRRWGCRTPGSTGRRSAAATGGVPDEEKEFGLGSSTPREMAALMERIARGRAVSADASRPMEALLGKQQVHELLCRLLPSADEGVTIAQQDRAGRGEAAGREGRARLGRMDAGIVTTPKGRTSSRSSRGGEGHALDGRQRRARDRRLGLARGLRPLHAMKARAVVALGPRGARAARCRRSRRSLVDGRVRAARRGGDGREGRPVRGPAPPRTSSCSRTASRSA
jgi:beta-lactamase class A